MTRRDVGAPGIYARLDANYDDDESMWEVSPLAELLWVRGLAYTKRKSTDGAIPLSALKRIATRIDADVDSLVTELVGVGLWIDNGYGWDIRNWANWQVSADVQSDIRKSRRQGGLSKAHAEGRHEHQPVGDCQRCMEAAHAVHMQCTSSAQAVHEQCTSSAHALHTACYLDLEGAASAVHVQQVEPLDEPEGESQADGEEHSFDNIRHIPKARVTGTDGRLNPAAAIRANLGLDQPVPKGLGMSGGVKKGRLSE